MERFLRNDRLVRKIRRREGNGSQNGGGGLCGLLFGSKKGENK